MATPVNKLKLLIVVPSLGCGGLERNVSIICNYIDTERFDVTCAILNNSRPFFKITNPGVKVIDLKINNVRMSLFAILKLNRQIKPDILFATANHLNLFLAIFKWLFPKRLKIIARESSIVSVNTQRTWNPKIYHWLLRVFYKKIDLIICQSEYMREDLLKNYGVPVEKTRLIYNSVTVPDTGNDDNNAAPYVKLITVGRLSTEKGFERLIRSVSYLKIPYQFTIIGEGYNRPVLEALIEKLGLQGKVILAGRDNKPFALVHNPDLFLMGSFYEGFPNAMLEALAAGIPAVAFNSPGGIAELLVNNQNGILVDGNDEHDFAQAIEKALNHPFDKEEIRRSTLQKFSVNTMMDKWYTVFETLK